MSDVQDPLRTSIEHLSGVLLAEQTVEELLGTVVELARQAVRGVDGVSVSLVQDGRLITSHATDDVVRELDGVQYRDGDGPCIEAVRAATVVHFDVGRDRSRFERFAEEADQRFITGVLSTPLTAGEQVLGGINCYSASTGHFGEQEAAVAAQFARQVSVLLANAAALADATSTNEQLRQALLSRDLIGQAKGMIMERRGIDADEAFDVLRRRSQQENKKLTVVAREVVESPRSVDGRPG